MNSTCPQCGGPLPANSPEGLCPKCLLQAGFESEVAPLGAAETNPSPQVQQGFVPPAAEELQQHFPQLEIIELLGRGGMGAVYKARQRELDRLVALKILPPEVGGDPAFAERFSREARALARLNHPNIVGVYDSGKAGGLYFFVMEYIDGVNLREAMQASKLTPEEAIAIVPQICDALQYAHDEGIVHRDIKPENVLVDSKGRVKIADFGLAKLLGHEPTDLTLTQTHQVMGTPRYMAPEQMTASYNVDHRADIYSLGVVFYELLTGEVPMGRFEAPSKRVQVDVRLDEIVLRTLEREPDRRYQRASEVKTAVETLRSQPIAALPKKPVVDERHSAEVDLDVARQEVKVPAIGLMVVGVLMCLLAVVPMCVGGGLMFRWWAVDYGPSMEPEKSPFHQDLEENNDPPLAEPPAPLDERTPKAPLPAEDEEPPAESSIRDTSSSGQLSPGASPTAICLSVAATGQYAEGYEGHDQASDAGDAAPRIDSSLSVTAVIALVSMTFLVLTTIVIGSIITWAGWRMMHLQSHGLAVTASILALLPCQPIFILSVGFGVWALIVLNRKQIKAAFGRVAEDRKRRSNTQSDQRTTTNSAKWQGEPITQIRFAVSDARDVMSQAIFHFSGLGYEVTEQRPDACVLQRGYKWGGLWETDIRRLHTRLTVRTAPAVQGETWVSCDWSVRTLGSWVTRRDVAKLEAEGRELEALLQGSGKTTSMTAAREPEKAGPARNSSSKIHGPAEMLIAAAIMALLTGIGIALWWLITGEFDATRPYLSGQGSLQWNMLMIAGVHGLYALLIGSAGVSIIRRRARLYALLVVIVIGLLLPAMFIVNCLGTHVREWPALIPFWIGMPVALWAAVTLLRGDVRDEYRRAANQRVSSSKLLWFAGIVGSVLLIVTCVLLAVRLWGGQPVGDYVIYDVVVDDSPDATPVDMDALVQAVDRRVNTGFAKVASVSASNSGKEPAIEIAIYGDELETRQQITRRMEAAGTLELRVLAHRIADEEVVMLAAEATGNDVATKATGDESAKLLARWVPATARWLEQKFDEGKVVTRTSPEGQTQVLVLLGESDVLQSDVKSVKVVTDDLGFPALSVTFNAHGAQQIANLTGENVSTDERARCLAIIINGRLESSPRIMSKVTSSAMLTGRFTSAEAADLAAILEAGALPAKLTLSSRTLPSSFDGEWVCVDMERDGGKVKLNRDLVSTFDGQQFVVKQGGQIVVAGTSKVNANTRPLEIETTYTAGENQGQTFKSIRKIEGDRITYCRAGSPGDPGPTEFKTTPGRGQLLTVYQRRK